MLSMALVHFFVSLGTVLVEHHCAEMFRIFQLAFFSNAGKSESQCTEEENNG